VEQDVVLLGVGGLGVPDPGGRRMGEKRKERRKE